MPAVLLILGAKSPPKPPLLVERDMHHLHGDQQQEVVEEGPTVEDENLPKNHVEYAQETWDSVCSDTAPELPAACEQQTGPCQC